MEDDLQITEDDLYIIEETAGPVLVLRLHKVVHDGQRLVAVAPLGVDRVGEVGGRHRRVLHLDNRDNRHNRHDRH